MSFLDFKHLLLVDLSSSGLFFYLAKDVKDPASIDFSNLSLLKKIYSDDFCQINLLKDKQLLHKTLEKNLKGFDLEEYSLVFLVANDLSEIEREALKSMAPFLKQVSVIDRHFFYNFYLMQKRNFSKTKFIVSLFDDCAELSLFDQEKLLVSEKVFQRNLPAFAKLFFKKAKDKFTFEHPDCFYLFEHNLAEFPSSAELAKYLKLEAIEIKELC